ncbi:MAG: hypothetical protein B6U88_02470 [Candidatus Aenigmarchaeota archaeon ex4484_56]|nr:MAG: hypothetical protein B6U88_02470 [Candidatus Aenigmarchaeota archaeon ex4484_56]
MLRLILDIENEKLKENIKKIISKIEYPLRFDEICICTTYKVEFIEGNVEKNLSIYINPEKCKNKILFNGYFIRNLFYLIDEKESLNKEIENNLKIPELVKFVQYFFADYKSIKYGFMNDMKKFYLERISKKVYQKEQISKKEYLEFYSFYLILKKLREEGEIKTLLDKLWISGLDLLIMELERLNYPYFLGDENLITAWKNCFN